MADFPFGHFISKNMNQRGWTELFDLMPLSDALRTVRAK